MCYNVNILITDQFSSSTFLICFLLPHHPHLSVLLFHNSPNPLLNNPLHNPALPVKTISADWENAVVRFQHVVACPDHDGFRQFRSNEAIYLIADFEYFLFVHRHSPFQFLCNKKPSVSIGTWFLIVYSIFHALCNYQLLPKYIINTVAFLISSLIQTKQESKKVQVLCKIKSVNLNLVH